MNDYEIMLMLDPELASERHEEVIGRVRELVERDGTWVGQDVWGRRKLAYEIDKKSEGVYYILAFDCPPATLDEITRVLKITDGVMRHMATRRINVATPAPAPAAVGAGQAEEYPAGPEQSETEQEGDQ